MVAEECRSTCFIEFAGSDHKNELNNVVLFRFHAQSIEVQKEVGCGEAGTLVPVDKGVVLYNAKKVGSCERTQVGLFIGLFLQRAMKRGFQCAFIADPIGTAMKTQLLKMQRFYETA